MVATQIQTPTQEDADSNERGPDLGNSAKARVRGGLWRRQLVGESDGIRPAGELVRCDDGCPRMGLTDIVLMSEKAVLIQILSLGDGRGERRSEEKVAEKEWEGTKWG